MTKKFGEVILFCDSLLIERRNFGILLEHAINYRREQNLKISDGTLMDIIKEAVILIDNEVNSICDADPRGFDLSEEQKAAASYFGKQLANRQKETGLDKDEYIDQLKTYIKGYGRNSFIVQQGEEFINAAFANHFNKGKKGSVPSM